MMKIIKYKILCNEINHGTEEEPKIEQIFVDRIIECPTDCLNANEEIAKKEAYNGEYTIEDDGQPEPVVEPTTEDVLNAMLGVTA